MAVSILPLPVFHLEEVKYDVAINFAKRVTSNVTEVQWPRTQPTMVRPDGSRPLRIHVNGLQKLKWWVFGYADQAVVCEPAELREAVQELAECTALNYDKHEGDPSLPPRRVPALLASAQEDRVGVQQIGRPQTVIGVGSCTVNGNRAVGEEFAGFSFRTGQGCLHEHVHRRHTVPLQQGLVVR